MSEHLVTGYAGHGHVTSADAGRLNAGIVGLERYVLGTGTKFKCEIENNNLIKIGSGDLIMQGRHVSIPHNSTVELNIENGTPAKKRIDVVAMRYSKDISTGVESAGLVLIKGTEVDSSQTAEPAQTTYGDIFAGDSIDEMPLYHILIENVIISEVKPVFALIPSICELNEKDNETEKECDRISKVSFSKATCTAKYSATDGCFIHSVTRGDRKSNVLLFTPTCIIQANDIVKLDGNAVTVKNLLSGKDMPYYGYWPDVTTLAFFDEQSNTLYIKPSNPMINGRYGITASLNSLVLTDAQTGKSSVFEPVRDQPEINVTLADGVRYVGTGIRLDKIGALIWALGVLYVEYTGEKKTIMTISREDGTADEIALNHLGGNDHFLSACNGNKIARLEWKNASDGMSVELVLHYIWDLATGKQAANGTYAVSVDSHYYAGE